MQGDTGPQLHIARIRQFDRGIFVGIQRLPDLPTPWPQNAPVMGHRSISSLATRCMREAQQSGDTSAIESAIADELVGEVTRILDEQMDSVVALVANAALEDGAGAPSERLASFRSLVEARLRVQRIRTAARREGVEDAIIAQLDSVIGGLDSAASALAGVASTVLGETFAKADAAERSRDRRLTLVATALLLPALFFALLGITGFRSKASKSGGSSSRCSLQAGTWRRGLVVGQVLFPGRPRVARSQWSQRRVSRS